MIMKYDTHSYLRFFRAALAALAMVAVPAVASAQSGQAGPIRSRAAEVHETFNLSPRGAVSVSNTSGNTVISSWGEEKVRIDAVKRGRGEFEQVEVEITPAADQIEIRVNYPRGRSDVSVDIELKVPRTAELTSINSASGNIEITGQVLRVGARSSSGNIAVRDIKENATLSTASGNVRADNIGGELRATSSSGNLTVNGVTSKLVVQSSSGTIVASRIDDDVVANAASGDIRITQARGRVTGRTASGKITIETVGGDAQAESLSESIVVNGVKGRLLMSSLSGNVTARNVAEGVQAKSISGNVEISDSRGRIAAGTTSGDVVLANIDSPDLSAKTTSGNVRFSGRLAADGHYEYESFSGDVTLTLPAESSFLINARTRSGSVKSDFQFKLSDVPQSTSRGFLSGTVGNGGAEVRASSFSGTVYIKKGANSK